MATAYSIVQKLPSVTLLMTDMLSANSSSSSGSKSRSWAAANETTSTVT